MHSVRVTRELDAPTDAVWNTLDDFGGVAKYNPGVESSRIIDGPETGTGATRECVLDGGGRIEEAITDYEPGVGYTVEFVDVGDFPLVSNVVRIEVDDLGQERTAVTMQSTFQPKYGPIGWVMAKTMMRSRFASTFENVLAGLESYVTEQSSETTTVDVGADADAAA